MNIPPIFGIYWFSGIAYLVAFLFTLWPSRTRLNLAAVFWAFGALTPAGFMVFRLKDFHLMEVVLLSHNPIPILWWLSPILDLFCFVIAGYLLLPRVSKAAARKGALWIFLVVMPVMIILRWPATDNSSRFTFPFNLTWLGVPLLWFRIRELRDSDRPDANQPTELMRGAAN